MRILILLLIYFIPTVIACYRKHGNMTAILLLNIFLGWTLIGWLIALIWSVTDNTKKDEIF